MSLSFQDIRKDNWTSSEAEKFLKVYGFCWLYGTNRVYREIQEEEQRMQDVINFVYIAIGY